ncbi:hypothetical protein [Actinomadura alba]|uniref:Uncharacterized protein n=1 Tax=Actinomadura alba TaxID=406431 RepID=A0ABR7M3J2_9ACTN|nr:hypothetical protein [Actinomadura alba]MBC6471267.1 hypothetical protein [Actinomadura alba]
MSKTDKTRPRWVRMADAAMVTCLPVHDHRFGPCTLPDEITADNASLSHRTSGCYWSATAYAYYLFGYGDGAGSGTTSDAKNAAAAVTRRAANYAPITAKTERRRRAVHGPPCLLPD